MSSTNTYTPLVIVCGGDDNFAMPTGVMLHSALLNLTPGIPVAIHVMSNGIKLASQAMIQRVVTQSGLPERNVSLSFLSVDTGVFEGFKTGPRHLNVSAYMRLLMPDLLPDHQRAIYLDADMVVHGNLAELWEQDFAGKDVLAVVDFGIGFASAPAGIHDYNKLGIDADTPYFNSGVMVVNLEQWRQTGLTARALAYIRDHQDVIQHADQEALNAAIGKNWGPLAPQWNVQVGAVQAFHTFAESPHKSALKPVIDHLCDEAKIMHYIGGRKPWNAGMTNPTRRHFDFYLWKSRWFPTALAYTIYRIGWLRRNLVMIYGDLVKN